MKLLKEVPSYAKDSKGVPSRRFEIENIRHTGQSLREHKPCRRMRNSPLAFSQVENSNLIDTYKREQWSFVALGRRAG